jgi:hypothetical protein
MYLGCILILPYHQYLQASPRKPFTHFSSGPSATCHTLVFKTCNRNLDRSLLTHARLDRISTILILVSTVPLHYRLIILPLDAAAVQYMAQPASLKQTCTGCGLIISVMTNRLHNWLAKYVKVSNLMLPDNPQPLKLTYIGNRPQPTPPLNIPQTTPQNTKLPPTATWSDEWQLYPSHKKKKKLSGKRFSQ